MELVTIPQALLLFYGALVLGCGAALGVIAGRNLRGKEDPSMIRPPDPIERRVRILEEEVDSLRGELRDSEAERDFLRELTKPQIPERTDPPTSMRAIA
jgi:hypothetical protein